MITYCQVLFYTKLDTVYLVHYNYSVKNYTWHKSKIDFEQLRLEIRKMSSSSKLYKIIKEELIKQDHWKQKARGNPMKAFHSRRKGNGT